MPPIQITNEQRDAAIADGNDTADAFAFGIVDEAFSQVSPPLSGYDGFTTDVKNAIKDGCKQFFAISSRYWQPIGASTIVAGPAYSITSDVQLADTTLTTFIPRKVMVTLNLSASSSATNTAIKFWIELNGVLAGTQLPFFFNSSSVHQSMGGSWVITVPAGSNIVTAWATRSSGTGAVSLNSDDSVSLSVIG